MGGTHSAICVKKSSVNYRKWRHQERQQ